MDSDDPKEIFVSWDKDMKGKSREVEKIRLEFSEDSPDANKYIRDLIDSHRDDIGPTCEIPLKMKMDSFLNVYSDGLDGPSKCKDYFMQISKIFVDAYTVIHSVTDHELYEQFKMEYTRLKKFNKLSKAFCENTRYFYQALNGRDYENADISIDHLSKKITLLKGSRDKILKAHEKMEEVPRHDSGISFAGIFNFFLKHWIVFFTVGILVLNMNFTEVFPALPGLWMNPAEAQFWSNAMTVLVRLFGAVCLTFVSSSWVATRVINYCLWILTEISVKFMVFAGSLFGLGGIFEFFGCPAKNIGMALRYTLISPVVFIVRYIASSVCLCVLRANSFGLSGLYTIRENIQNVVGDLAISSGESITVFLGKITRYMYENSMVITQFIAQLAIKAVSAEFYKTTAGKVVDSVSGWWGTDADPVVGEGFHVEDIEDDFDVFGGGRQLRIGADSLPIGSQGGQLATLGERQKAKMERATRDAMNAVTIMVHEEGKMLMTHAKEAIDETFEEVKERTIHAYEEKLLEQPVNYKMIHELEKLETDDLRITWGDGLMMAMLVDFVNWSWRNTAVTSRSSRNRKIFRKIRALLPMILLMISIVMTQLDMSAIDFSESGMSMVQFFNFTE